MESVLDEVRALAAATFDRNPTWSACAESGLLALAAPESQGGDGLGLAEVGVALQEAGRRALTLPLRETLSALVALAPYDGVPADVVPRVIAGDLLLLPALNEVGVALPSAPTTRLVDGRVTGRKLAVAVHDIPSLLVVSVTGADGPLIALVDPAATGVTAIPTPSSRGAAEATYTFDDAAVLATLDAAATVRAHAIAGLLLTGDGLVAGARDLTSGYIAEREQFGRKLAEFQAVAQQIADVFVASRLVSLQAAEVARRVVAGEDAADDLAVGSFLFCDRAPAALQTCHHLHGGVGVDETYPLAAYYSQVRDVTRLLGGVEATLAAVPVQESAAKNAELTEAQRAFKAEARDYFATLASDDDRDEMLTDRHGPAYHRIIKQMGSDGWMGVGWPVEYGGKGLGGIEQQIFANEAARADVHLPSVTLQTVGPTLQAFGTEKQKEKFLADILTGDVHFAIGYSEAEAGTDLASLACSARRDGDHYVVNGQKMWTTGGHAADYIWLAVRTDPDAPKHKGISVLIVDTKDPGFSYTPIVTVDGSHHVNATYYDNVRVPVDMLVGEENRGWQLITTQLNHERVMLGPAGRLEGLRDQVRAWAATQSAPDGSPLLSVPTVRATLARVTASFRVNELLNWQVASSTATGPDAVADSSASKVFASDEVQRLGLALAEIVTAAGDPADPATGRLMHYLDCTAKRNLVLTFGGGVNEVQRELIAQFGLGLPRVPR